VGNPKKPQRHKVVRTGVGTSRESGQGGGDYTARSEEGETAGAVRRTGRGGRLRCSSFRDTYYSRETDSLILLLPLRLHKPQSQGIFRSAVPIDHKKKKNKFLTGLLLLLFNFNFS